ncbi:MAG: hypothetical protein IH805_02205 [Proteobacteria bacterium]|nr:hypothetical protein [Pseudomonadota bacterium]
MGRTHRHNIRLISVAAVLAVVIFLIDLSLPLGVAGGVPYVAVVLIGWWIDRRQIFLLALVVSALTVAGYLYSPEGGIASVVLTNRFLALFAIWVTAALLAKAKTAETTLKFAHDELETVGLIDVDADRRILVAEEQELIGSDYRREIFQGDISHPEVWTNLEASIDLHVREPTVILGTGSSEKNLRAALWIKQRHPNAQVFARTNDVSQLALEVGAEHDIRCFSIRQLIEDNLPENWVN